MDDAVFLEGRLQRAELVQRGIATHAFVDLEASAGDDGVLVREGTRFDRGGRLFV